MANITPLHDQNAPTKKGSGASAKDVHAIFPSVFSADHLPPPHISMEQALDKGVNSSLARFTGGVSPIALAAAYADWALHLSSSPGKQLQLMEKAGKKAWRFANL